ncbi:hypothetical protein J3E68DRAFT_425292 [Trichoderma sp. SZMC 28012]
MVTDSRRNSRYLKCDENPVKCIGDRKFLNHIYIIVPLGKEFSTRSEEQWRRLTKTRLLTLMVHEDDGPVPWDARIQEASRGITVLDSHPTDLNDLVLHLRRPRPEALKGPENRVPLKFPDQIADYESKVDAVWQFRPNARPTKPKVWGMSPDEKEADGMTRALLRSTGFWDALVRSPDEVDQLAEALAIARLNADTNTDIAEQAKMLLPDRLPVSDLIALPAEHLNALMEEVLPADRKRFVKYMSERLSGLCCITVGPGFGKTTALAVGTLAMTATLGQIYGTAPMHVATDNFAERFDLTSKRVTQCLHQGKANGDTTRARRALVIRGYLPSEEGIRRIHEYIARSKHRR